MKERIIILFSVLLLSSCGGINFVLENDATNTGLSEKTLLINNNKTNSIFNQEMSSYFRADKEYDYILITNLSEEKENRLVKQNQVAEKIDYKLIVDYELFYKNRGCKILVKQLVSQFSFVPKSFGYNFGTDRSLEKLYRNSIEKNISEFVELVPEKNNCI